MWSVLPVTTFAVPFEVDISLLCVYFSWWRTCGFYSQKPVVSLMCCSAALCTWMLKKLVSHTQCTMPSRWPWSPFLEAHPFTAVPCFPDRLTAYCRTACHTALFFNKYINTLVMELLCMISVSPVWHPALPQIVPWKKHNIKGALTCRILKAEITSMNSEDWKFSWIWVFFFLFVKKL